MLPCLAHTCSEQGKRFSAVLDWCQKETSKFLPGNTQKHLHEWCCIKMGMPGVCESALPQDIQSTSTLLIFSVKSKYYPSHKGLLCAAALSSSGLDALLQSHIAVLPTHRFCTPASSQLLCSALYKQLLRALGAGC